MTPPAPIARGRRSDGADEVLEEVRRLLAEHRDVVIFGHKDADGDALGSCLAFAEALRRRRHRVRVVIPPPHPDLYNWLPGFGDLLEEPPQDARDGVAL
ncbi:MAG: hypothetical protein J2P38_12025, partial [Candidatus Dormibacteraeota bacterium]|nr:hypothetical protein [Candidatus Dormibacteraeota bacterium]